MAKVGQVQRNYLWLRCTCPTLAILARIIKKAFHLKSIMLYLSQIYKIEWREHEKNYF